MSSNQKFKITKLTIFKLVFFIIGVVAMIWLAKIDKKESLLVWEESNNINPIKCGITGEVDSIRFIGRSIFLKMKTGEKFLIQIGLLDEKDKNYYRLSSTYNMINVGDSLIKESNSKIAYIIKKDSYDSVKLKLNDLNYGNLPCTPVLSQ